MTECKCGISWLLAWNNMLVRFLQFGIRDCQQQRAVSWPGRPSVWKVVFVKWRTCTESQVHLQLIFYLTGRLTTAKLYHMTHLLQFIWLSFDRCCKPGINCFILTYYKHKICLISVEKGQSLSVRTKFCTALPWEFESHEEVSGPVLQRQVCQWA